MEKEKLENLKSALNYVNINYPAKRIFLTGSWGLYLQGVSCKEPNDIDIVLYNPLGSTVQWLNTYPLVEKGKVYTDDKGDVVSDYECPFGEKPTVNYKLKLKNATVDLFCSFDIHPKVLSEPLATFEGVEIAPAWWTIGKKLACGRDKDFTFLGDPWGLLKGNGMITFKVDLPKPTSNATGVPDYEDAVQAQRALRQISPYYEKRPLTNMEWGDESIIKYSIDRVQGKLVVLPRKRVYSLLAFRDKETAELFLERNSFLIKKYYGIW